ncbi:MAG: hypothetical protein ACTHJ1_12900 [Bordetella sp.]|uniref:hypothetical protein n=1 Tax=Bordetella sp. TaxID=28081 RepID=UPI003F7B5801
MKICVIAATLTVAVSLVPLDAWATPYFLNKTIAVGIAAKDSPAFKTAVAHALDKTPDGAVYEWASSPGRHNQPVKFAFTPQQTVQTKSAGTCRLLAAKVSQLSAVENWRFWFCKQPNGSWKAGSAQ